MAFVLACGLSLAFKEPFGWPWIVAGALLVLLLTGYWRLDRRRSAGRLPPTPRGNGSRRE